MSQLKPLSYFFEDTTYVMLGETALTPQVWIFFPSPKGTLRSAIWAMALGHFCIIMHAKNTYIC